ncbi:MAG: MerR family transcriptional regulator [Rickettsiales bacterium]|nr:MerR family transcriptional regulator [Rickettsiales bacterium]
MTNDIAREVEKLADDLGVDRKRSIGEAARELKIETHVIRFWEEKFPQIKPEIGAGKRRYYYNRQLKVLKRIKQFLYEEGYTINGLQKLLKKRKQNNYQDEDLDIILEAEILTKESTAKNNAENFSINDFILTDEVKKLDQEIIIKLQNLTKNIRNNLVKLKSIFEQEK